MLSKALSLRGMLIGIIIISVGIVVYIVILNLPPRPILWTRLAPAETASTTVAQAVPRQNIGAPVRLIIPALTIDTKIQAVGLTASGAMANPQGINKFRETGWYKNGPRPGQVGSAVIDGHLDNALGLKGVFYDLNKLQAGDTIIVETDAGEQAEFRVISSEIYDYQNAPNEKIFNMNNGMALLNLITCDGTWLKDVKSYDKRLVVYTKLISVSNPL